MMLVTEAIARKTCSCRLSVSVNPPPRPDVEADLGTLDHRQPGMPRFMPTSASAVRSEILPVHGVSSQGFEYNAGTSAGGPGTLGVCFCILRVSEFTGLSIAQTFLIMSLGGAALYETAPPRVEARSLQLRKFRASAQEGLGLVLGRTVSPHHEGAHATPAAKGRAPVEMVTVVPPGAVALRTEALDPLLLPPALKGPRPRLDAPDHLGPGDQGDLRVPHGLIPLCGRAVVSDGRRLKNGLAVCSER